MKILHIINVRWFNATAWYAFRLAKAGRDLGYESIIAGLPNSPIINKAKEIGIETFETNFNSNKPIQIIKNIKETSKFIRDTKPDIIVCHRGEMFWWFALYNRFINDSFKLVRVRGDIRPPTTDFFSKYTHNKCAKVIVTSANLIRDRFINTLNTPKDKVYTVYGGVDTSVFKKDETLRKNKRKELNYSDNDFVVSIVGRFDPVKGHDTFLKACGKLYKEGMKNLKILLVGFPENIKVDEIRYMIKDNGLEEISFITGKVDKVESYMNASDLGVVASIGSEAICRVAMEYMACGVPVVSSDAGVLPEMFESPNLYKMKDYEELAESIKNHKQNMKIYDEIDFFKEFISICEKVN